MAWLSSGRTNTELVDRMASNGLITSDKVAQAMKLVDRKHYVPTRSAAYDDSPQRIGFNATISAPHMHAHACENLLAYIERADRGGAILDVGSGSGYLTAVLHRLAPSATVIGIDHIRGLTDMSRANLAKDGVALGVAHGIDIVLGDGRAAPYAAIHVGAAAPAIPEALVAQLASPGRMFIPVGVGHQDIWQVDKDEHGAVTRTKLFGVMYVPLTDRDAQWSEEE
ncbi:Protein-L-isoaspartate(D-aspartate) O-methyltransferase [Vanrija pseudolonga]|uniref:protein-L-isoaspartate(D-aspartate) O-methyltransferase n=1 Tax=Vanrija pseudolonga TaxID=143232 RepID=A0AAF1BRF8_9TREE|nr:Protein-L-isoaspartate(D-aspartate) O-methyltransferase [Vanrija pseudolonga]